MTFRESLFGIWRWLPARWRQKAAHAVLDAVAPRPSRTRPVLSASREIPRILVGFLSSPSGLGQSARLAAAALKGEGYTVHGIDLSSYFFEVSDTIAHGLPDGRAVIGPAHVIININAPYLPYVLWVLGRRFLRGKHVTGYWAWELTRLPQSWRRGLACVHSLAAPSRFVADAVRSLDADRDVRVAPHPVALDHPPLSPLLREGRRPDQPFTVLSTLSVASGFERKNPTALIRAFRSAFGEDPTCRLRLHVTNADHHAPARPAIEAAVAGAANIEIDWGNKTRAELWDWWGTPDVYLSLHRSEGFGLPMAEAMCAGYPVVATGWSANAEFMTPENACPVAFRLVDVVDPQSKYQSDLGQWAEPDCDDAARHLRRLRDDPDHARALARHARETAMAQLSGAAFCRSLIDGASEEAALKRG